MVILMIKKPGEKVREKRERERVCVCVRNKTDYKHTTSAGGVSKGY
jgi:hypothetical protein